jgi:gluconolactonase
MHPSLTIYNNSVFDFINKDFEIKKLAGDCMFSEGPVWNKQGFYLFSDIPANCIYKITGEGKKEIFLSNSGTNNAGDPDLKPDQIGSNGLDYHYNGNLLICQHGNHSIAQYDGVEVKTFIADYNGRPFNSPNDLVFHTNGVLFFSDPPYGLKDGKLNPQKFQPVAGVYSYHQFSETLELICDKYQYPNGVCLSPDGKLLFICSNKPFEKFISMYNAETGKFIKIFAEENSDGIKCDAKGNVYLCNKDGIIILNTRGERLALLKLPTIPANICWGGKDLNDLFITARENIFLIKGLQN